MRLRSWWRALSEAGAPSGAKPDLAVDLDKARPFAFLAHTPQCLFPAFGIVIYAASNQPAHLLIGEDQIVGAIDTHAEFLARPFDQLNEIPIGDFHGVPPMFRSRNKPTDADNC
jgi:hypothetical protein